MLLLLLVLFSQLQITGTRKLVLLRWTMLVVAVIRILFPRPHLDQHNHSLLNQLCLCFYCAGGKDDRQSPLSRTFSRMVLQHL